MKQFAMREVKESREHAMAGGQALHLWKPQGGWYPGAPAVFLRNAKLWGHLLDQDVDRLEATARRLGVRRIKVGQRGNRYQHIDLCGKPLARAIEECNEE